MREIKFRAWNPKLKQMKPVFSLIDIHHVACRYVVDKYTLEEWEELDDVVLMQYTGLKDKNGKEIYEGDICRLDNRDCDDGEIMWTTNEYRFCNDYMQESLTVYANRLEIIGNIYENPDLIKEKING